MEQRGRDVVIKGRYYGRGDCSHLNFSSLFEEATPPDKASTASVREGERRAREVDLHDGKAWAPRPLLSSLSQLLCILHSTILKKHVEETETQVSAENND